MGEAEAAARRFFELVEDGTPDDYGTARFITALYADDCDIRVPSPTTGALEQHSPGDGAAKHARSALRFRDRRVTSYELIADGPHALMRYVWQVTVRDDSTEFPPGAVYRTDVAHFIEVKNGKIVRSHEYNHMENGAVVHSHEVRAITGAGSAEAMVSRLVETYNRASSGADYISMFAEDLDWWHMTDWWRGNDARFSRGKSGGLTDYREAIESESTAVTERKIEPYLVIADGSRAAVRYRWSAVDFAGDRFEWDRVAVITVNKDRITRLHEYGGPVVGRVVPLPTL